MTPYRNLSGESNVVSYEITEDSMYASGEPILNRGQ